MALASSAPEAAPRRRFVEWYRRYYLLVNVPILLAITELVLARVDLARRLPFDSDDFTAAIHRMEANPPGDKRVVLLLGNSAMREGVDQRVIETALGNVRAYNFGLSAARLDDTAELLELLRERGVNPSMVVLGVNPFLVDDEVNPETIYPWVAQRSPYLYFHRSRIRTSILRGAGYLLASPARRVELAERWDAESQFKCSRGASPDSSEEFTRKFVAEFGSRRPDELPMIEELPHFVDRLKESGIAVRVVLLPMNPIGTSRLVTYRALMAAIRAHLPPDTLDLSDEFPADVFHDMGHVNERGRARLSAAIGSWLQTKETRWK
jgi:hypothetical protein